MNSNLSSNNLTLKKPLNFQSNSSAIFKSNKSRNQLSDEHAPRSATESTLLNKPTHQISWGKTTRMAKMLGINKTFESEIKTNSDSEEPKQ